MRWAFDVIWDALSGLRDKIGEFTGWCSTTATAWQNKYIIGPYVSAVLWQLYIFGWNLRYKVIDLRGGLESLGDFVTGIDDGWKLDDLIGRLWSGWGSFTRDARGYILDRVFPLGTELYWFSVDPIGYVDYWIDTKWPNLKHIAYNPAQYVLDRVFPVGSDMYWFRQDPGYMIEFKLTERFPGLAAFLYDPVGWLRDGIDDAKQEILDTVKAGLLRMVQEVIEANW